MFVTSTIWVAQLIRAVEILLQHAPVSHIKKTNPECDGWTHSHRLVLFNGFLSTDINATRLLTLKPMKTPRFSASIQTNQISSTTLSSTFSAEQKWCVHFSIRNISLAFVKTRIPVTSARKKLKKTPTHK